MRFAIFGTLLGLSSIVLTGCSIPEPTTSDPLMGYETYTVTGSSFATTTTRIGTVTPIEEVVISTESAGRLLFIEDMLGKTIYAGDVLAKLDTEEISVQGATASNIAQLLGETKTSTESMFDAQIQGMYNQLAIAQEQVSIAQKGAHAESMNKDDSLGIIDQQITTAKKALDNLDGVYQQKKQTILAGAEDALNRASITALDILDFMDAFLGVSPLHEKDNDAFENNIAARNTSLKYDAITMRQSLDNRKKTLQTTFEHLRPQFRTDNLDDTTFQQALVSLLDEATVYMQDLENALKLMQDVISYSVPTTTLSEQQLTNYQQQISIFQHSIESLLLTTDNENLLGLKGTKKMIAGLSASYDLDITNQQQQIATLEKQRLAVENGQGSKADIAQQQIRVAQENVKALERQIEALEQQKNTQLEMLDTKRAEAGGQINQIATLQKNGTILSPFDARIMEEYVDPGVVVGPGMPLLKIGSSDGKVIRASLPEKYRSYLEVGKDIPVEINTVFYTGTISEIAPGTDLGSRTIQITLLLPPGETIEWGNIGKIHISAIDKNNKDDTSLGKQLTLPTQYITYIHGNAYVWKRNKTNKQVEKQRIILDSCNDDYCIITSGIQGGDLIIHM